MEFAYWLKSMRESAGMTIQQVADELGIEKTTVARYEKGSLNRIKNKEKIIKAMQQLVKKEMTERRKNGESK